jgi:hypothetical protein
MALVLGEVGESQAACLSQWDAAHALRPDVPCGHWKLWYGGFLTGLPYGYFARQPFARNIEAMGSKVFRIRAAVAAKKDKRECVYRKIKENGSPRGGLRCFVWVTTPP